jgi:hypothetical protein
MTGEYSDVAVDRTCVDNAWISHEKNEEKCTEHSEKPV